MGDRIRCPIPRILPKEKKKEVSPGKREMGQRATFALITAESNRFGGFYMESIIDIT